MPTAIVTLILGQGAGGKSMTALSPLGDLP